MDGERGNPQFSGQPFGHTVAIVCVVWACLGVVENDAVKFEEVVTVLDVLFLVHFIPDNKQLRVCSSHALEGLLRIQLIEDPAVAVGGCHHAGLELRKLLGQRSQFSPDGHSLPVEAVFLTLYGSHTIADSLLELFQQQLIIVHRFLRPPGNDSRTHMDGSVKKSPRRRHCSSRLQARSPELRGASGERNSLLESIQVKTLPADLFQCRNQVLDLLGDVLDLIGADLTDVPVGVNPHERYVQFP